MGSALLVQNHVLPQRGPCAMFVHVWN